MATQFSYAIDIRKECNRGVWVASPDVVEAFTYEGTIAEAIKDIAGFPEEARLETASRSTLKRPFDHRSALAVVWTNLQVLFRHPIVETAMPCVNMPGECR